MNWYPEPLPVPAGLEHDRFVFEPLGPEHVDRDYESLMDSKEHLRRWSGTSWPADDFTVAEPLWQNMRRARAFFAGLRFWEMVPKNELLIAKVTPLQQGAGLLVLWHGHDGRDELGLEPVEGDAG